jgi:hypothetical protein
LRVIGNYAFSQIRGHQQVFGYHHQQHVLTNLCEHAEELAARIRAAMLGFARLSAALAQATFLDKFYSAISHESV